jgi:hypothetical protein
MASPTSRSLEILRKDGYSAQVVERFNPYAKVRVDLFGFIDIVAIRDDTPGVIAIQTTSSSNLTNRIKKILGIPEAKIWLQGGNSIYVHGWSKKGKKDNRKLWKITIKRILISDFEPDFILPE